MPFFRAEHIEDDLPLRATPTKARATSTAGLGWAGLGWAGLARRNMSCYGPDSDSDSDSAAAVGRTCSAYSLVRIIALYLQHVPAQMWRGPGANVAQSPRRCGAVPAQMWPEKRRVQILPAQGARRAAGLLFEHIVDSVQEHHHGVVRGRRKREISAAKEGGGAISTGRGANG